MKINLNSKIVTSKFFIVCVILLLTACNAQRRLEKEAMKKQQEVLDRKDERSAERMADYEMAMQQHYDNQSKKTQRMMRKSFKKAEKLKYNKKDFFLARWFKDAFGYKNHTKKRRATK